MDENAWRYELSLFATDLFSDLMSRHPLLYMLPREHGGSQYFKTEVSKCVMLKWHEIRNGLEQKLRSDFPRFVKSENCFRQYLRLFVDVVLQSENNAMSQVFELSAILLGVVCFVHRRGMTNFVHDAKNYLFFMLLSVKPEEFYEEGGWPCFVSASAKLIDGYDEEEICRQYLLQTVCNFNASCSTFTIKSSSNLKFSPDTSSRITEKKFQEVSGYHEPVKECKTGSANEHETSNEITETFQEISPQHDKESGDDSEQDSTLRKAETKCLSPCESPSILKQKPLVTPISESAVFESKKESKTDSANEHETFQETSPQHKESRDDSEQDSTLRKAETKCLSPFETPSILKKKPLVTSISESAVFESKNVTGDSSESKEYLESPKLVKCSQTETESPITSGCVQASETESSLEDSSFQASETESSLEYSSFQASLKLKASQTNLETLGESTERKTPDSVVPSMYDSNSSTAESLKSAEDFVEPKNCLHESLTVETSAIDSECIDEVDKFLIDYITTHFRVRFLTEEEIKAGKYFSEDEIDSTTENSSQHKPTDKVTNNGDETKTNLKDSTRQKHCDVNSLRDEVSQTSLEVINSCQEESKEENLENVEVIPPRKLPTCTEQICDNGSAKMKSSSLFKSPKVKTVSKFTPPKAKIPPFETCGVGDKKNKTSTLKTDGKATPIKTPTSCTSKPPMLGNTSGRSKRGTPKTLKSDSAERRSPVYPKTPTDRELPKFQSKSDKIETSRRLSLTKSSSNITKSSDKIETSRRLSLPKASPEITKSSTKIETGRRLSLPKASPEITKSSLKTISASAANVKLGIKCIPATDSSKSLPTVLKSKTTSKDLPSNQLKASSSIVSDSAPKCKMEAKDAPVACEKVKKMLKSLKSETENVKDSISLEKPAGSSSNKPTEATVSKPDKSSTESLDTRCAETKGYNPPIVSAKCTNHSNTGRTRNLHGKGASVDPKSEKPRWR